jgi:hypothetical protein
MNRVGVGRVLVASLHQGIADLIPSRLEFYENWLRPTGLRDGSIGLAPLVAVMSFLRQEGDPYDLVTARAGAYAAQWIFDGLSPFERSVVGSLPSGLRTRTALQLTKRVIRQSYLATRATSTFRHGAGDITMRGSAFCSVREPFARALCGYYASALQRSLALVGVDGQVVVRSCEGMGAASCVIALKVPPAPGQG